MPCSDILVSRDTPHNAEFQTISKSIEIGRTAQMRAAPYHVRLWVFGDSVGEACWRRGYETGLREMAPSKGIIRLDLSLNQLLQLA
jgi:hypothetical protein